MPGLGGALVLFGVLAAALLGATIWMLVVAIHNLRDPDQPRKPVLACILAAYMAGVAGHFYLFRNVPDMPRPWSDPAVDVFTLLILSAVVLSMFATDVRWSVLPASLILATSWLICLNLIAN